MTKENPRVFLSYDHGKAQLVDQIAHELMEKGIDVVYDVWELSEGDDLFKFMESSVNDPSIDFVLIVSDRNYKLKADNRDGSGVSTEAVIISLDVYRSVKDSRFIPIATELDENNVAVMPTFTSSKLYVDFTLTAQSFDEAMDSLLRRLYGEPQQRKPALGKKPNFKKEESIASGRLTIIGNEIERVRDVNVRHAFHTFQDKFIPEFITVYKKWVEETNLSEDILTANEKFKKGNNLFIKIFDIVASEFEGFDSRLVIQLLSEIVAITDRNSNLYTKDTIASVPRYDLFLRICAILLKNGQFTILNEVLEFRYSTEIRGNFELFYPLSFVRELSSEGHLPLVNAIETNLGSTEFNRIVQADLILFYISKVRYKFWYPLLWGKWNNNTFSIMKQLSNKRYATQFAILFDASTAQELYKELSRVEPITNDRTWGWFTDFPMPLQFVDQSVVEEAKLT